MLIETVDTNIEKWIYLHERIPGMKYNHIRTSYKEGNNLVGDQQRTFVIWWAINEHLRSVNEFAPNREGVGLDIGCGQATSVFCIGTDFYSGNNHPFYGGVYKPHIKCIGEVLPLKNESIDFIVSHHSLEHMQDLDHTLLEWLRVLRKGGRICVVMPDRSHGTSWDGNHLSETTPKNMKEILSKLNIRMVEFDTLNNDFSFNFVIEKL